MAEIMPQKTRGDYAFRPSQQTFGAVINRPADGLLLSSTDSTTSLLASASPVIAMLPSTTSTVPSVSPLIPSLPSSSIGVPHSLGQEPVSHQLSLSDLQSNRRGRAHLPNNVITGYDASIPPSSSLPPPLDSATNSTSRSRSRSRSSTVTSSSQQKRKYPAQIDQLSISSSAKRQRATGGTVALHTLSQGMETFNAQFGAFMNAAQARQEQKKSSSPERRAKAQDIIQDEHSTYLNAEQIVLVCDVFEVNTRAADTFLNFKKFEYRKAWVDLQLKRAGYTINHPSDNSN